MLELKQDLGDRALISVCTNASTSNLTQECVLEQQLHPATQASLMHSSKGILNLPNSNFHLCSLLKKSLGQDS